MLLTTVALKGFFGWFYAITNQQYITNIQGVVFVAGFLGPGIENIRKFDFELHSEVIAVFSLNDSVEQAWTVAVERKKLGHIC